MTDRRLSPSILQTAFKGTASGVFLTYLSLHFLSVKELLLGSLNNPEFEATYMQFDFFFFSYHAPIWQRQLQRQGKRQQQRQWQRLVDCGRRKACLSLSQTWQFLVSLIIGMLKSGSIFKD